MSWLDKEVEGSEYKYLEIPNLLPMRGVEGLAPRLNSCEVRPWSIKEKERFMFLVAQVRSRKRRWPEAMKPLHWAQFTAWLRQWFRRP